MICKTSTVYIENLGEDVDIVSVGMIRQQVEALTQALESWPDSCHCIPMPPVIQELVDALKNPREIVTDE